MPVTKLENLLIKKWMGLILVQKYEKVRDW